MSLEELPAQAAWRHVDAREGFEVLFARAGAGGQRLAGHTTGVESGAAWSVGYEIDVDARWRTLTARVTNRTAEGAGEVVLERRSGDRWYVDGERRCELDGCVDVDLESSAVTNTLPIHRLELPVGERVDVPAAFVRADDLRVERLEQSYTRLDTDGCFAYASSTFDFACELRYDASGLVADYPGIAVRVA